MIRDAAAAKKLSSNVFENYFESMYPPLPLPAIWRVIYHEAVRGNHILWENTEVEGIEREFQSTNFKMNPEDTISITRFMAKFFSSGDFRDLKAMISELPQNQKAVAFLLYRRALTVWQRWLKTNLH